MDKKGGGGIYRKMFQKGGGGTSRLCPLPLNPPLQLMETNTWTWSTTLTECLDSLSNKMARSGISGGPAREIFIPKQVYLLLRESDLHQVHMYQT